MNAKSIDNRTRTSDKENVIVQTRQTALSIVSNASGERWWLPVLENMVHCSGVGVGVGVGVGAVRRVRIVRFAGIVQLLAKNSLLLPTALRVVGNVSVGKG